MIMAFSVAVSVLLVDKSGRIPSACRAGALDSSDFCLLGSGVALHAMCRLGGGPLQPVNIGLVEGAPGRGLRRIGLGVRVYRP